MIFLVFNITHRLGLRSLLVIRHKLLSFLEIRSLMEICNWTCLFVLFLFFCFAFFSFSWLDFRKVIRCVFPRRYWQRWCCVVIHMEFIEPPNIFGWYLNFETTEDRNSSNKTKCAKRQIWPRFSMQTIDLLKKVVR